MKFVYFNDTDRLVSIHPATQIHGCECDMNAIDPLEERVFLLPEGTYPWVKMWDYGKSGLQILVSPRSETNNKGVKHEPSSQERMVNMQREFDSFFGHLAKKNPHDKKESR